MDVLNYTLGHALKDSPNCTPWPTAGLLHVVLPSMLSRILPSTRSYTLPIGLKYMLPACLTICCQVIYAPSKLTSIHPITIASTLLIVLRRPGTRMGGAGDVWPIVIG
jgi:hypothetical protein